MKIRTGDTIAAISTPQGVGGISIVRMSGKDALKIGDKIFRGKGSLQKSPDKTIRHGNIIDPSDNTVIDEVLCMVMHAPNTYTGENILEINTHGGVYLAKKILRLILKSGARLAKRGEFTLRAFINGRLDLIQAEAVKELIEADSDTGISISIAQLKGELSGRIRKIRKELIDIYALFEVQIDFSDENIDKVKYEDLQKKINSVYKKLKSLKGSYGRKREKTEKINIIIAGCTNTGKSTLFNRLIEEDKAIVDESPGTTRDVVDAEVIFAGRRCRIADTAGLRGTPERIESKGINRTEKELASSDMVLLVEDISKDEDCSDIQKNLEKHKGKMLFVKNKTDLIKEKNLVKNRSGNSETVFVSAKTGAGIKTLVDRIANKLNSNVVKNRDTAFVMNERQADLIEKGYLEVFELKKGFEKHISLEYLAVNLKTAVEYLDDITGDRFSEEVLDNIFSNFCIGK
ncbi:tRNA uridine-5-carboxymethylaminomethyl(34) synthesis GTPase MnmE [candidate division KSB1 bacterium]